MPGFKESMMAKMTKAEQTRHQQDDVFSQWASRPLNQRTTNDAEQFADELWTHGPQMGYTQETHRQMVMNVIRAHIRNP
jgi:hypothetical protein